MSLAALIAATFAASIQTASPPIGQRTAAPRQMLQGLAAGLSEEEAAIAAAQVRPLGTMDNPVRVGGPEGEQAYLARLRCGDGSAPRIGQPSSMGPGAFGSLVDGYALDCGSSAPGRFTIVMDKYHDEHREDRAPAGFTILPRAAE
ncbi:MAG: hypothetical protein JWL74_299 [Alphaproteobacteria bacterium]|jgi:hypothetical protein|nr:hypothetical protein [Alphaproteobacteria bacterium]